MMKFNLTILQSRTGSTFNRKEARRLPSFKISFIYLTLVIQQSEYSISGRSSNTADKQLHLIRPSIPDGLLTGRTMIRK